jgi:3-hydroxybutyryl-CoA dehydrogenase
MVGEIKKICVLGAGTMGHQIALQCALYDYEVHLVDISKKALEKAVEKIRNILEDRVNCREMSSDSMSKTLSRITCTTDLEKAAKDADFAIEAIYENVEMKQHIFSQLDDICPPHTILASNTSSIKSSILANATKRPEKVLAVNFENSVWEYPMVEIMGAVKTSEETIKATKQLVKSIGLTPILVKKEIQGYAFNRIWRAIKKEALHLVDEGYVSFEDVDRAFMIGMGISVGPFMMMDTIGLDVVLAIEEQYYRESGDESDKPPKILIKKVKKGELGIKTGKGFYKYPNPNFESPNWLKGVDS